VNEALLLSCHSPLGVTVNKRLIVCADGTWNDEDRAGAPTNVAKMHAALETHYVEGTNQWVYYHSGVGTKWGERLRGGAFGRGINKNIRECYEFLVDHYEYGDELYFFGFSRGAYTVRSLTGLLRNSGIVKDRSAIRQALALYRSRDLDRHPAAPVAISFRRRYAKQARAGDGQQGGDDNPFAYSPDVKFIGVWDTVGALGYPLPFFRFWKPILSALGVNWWFHDTDLSRTVQHAYQALAIHERRTDFMPTLWLQQLDDKGLPQRSDQTLEQVWFTGVHSDVGGGYGATGLSDLAFRWMLNKAATCGLSLRPGSFEPGPLLAPNPLGHQHESLTGAFLLLDALRLRLHGTQRTFSDDRAQCARIADSVIERFRKMPAAEWPSEGGANAFRARLETLATSSADDEARFIADILPELGVQHRASPPIDPDPSGPRPKERAPAQIPPP
jgi:uncharacterized protein (DUF2235 family)